MEKKKECPFCLGPIGIERGCSYPCPGCLKSFHTECADKYFLGQGRNVCLCCENPVLAIDMDPEEAYNLQTALALSESLCFEMGNNSNKRKLDPEELVPQVKRPKAHFDLEEQGTPGKCEPLRPPASEVIDKVLAKAPVQVDNQQNKKEVDQKQSEKETKMVEKEAKKKATQAQKTASQAEKKAAKEAAQLQKKAEKKAEQAQKKAQKKAEQAQKKAEKKAEKKVEKKSEPARKRRAKKVPILKADSDESDLEAEDRRSCDLCGKVVFSECLVRPFGEFCSYVCVNQASLGLQPDARNKFYPKKKAGVKRANEVKESPVEPPQLVVPRVSDYQYDRTPHCLACNHVFEDCDLPYVVDFDDIGHRACDQVCRTIRYKVCDQVCRTDFIFTHSNPRPPMLLCQSDGDWIPNIEGAVKVEVRV